MTSGKLAEAYQALLDAGASARLPDDDVRDEAATVAAGVCVSAPEAGTEWAKVFDLPVNRFGAHARQGAVYDGMATPLLQRLVRGGEAQPYAVALAGLAIEASSLDPDPSLACINKAGMIARMQLAAAGVAPTAVPYPSTVPATTETPDAPPPPPPQETLPELMAKLDALIGLTKVKDQVHRQVALLRVNQLRTAKGLKSPDVSRHLVFVGNPGTGKTTVARLVAGIYRALGILEKGQLVETERAGLVAGYEGQTAIKTSDVVKSALGGVLFIDEAYALSSDEYGAEAIATLVKAMEDHRDTLVVIVAGYTDKMAEFMEANPGLESRFGTTISFPDYTDDELVQIFQQLCKDADFTPTDECITTLRTRLKSEPRDEGFGNGRFVRNLFEHAVERQAWRLRSETSPSVDDLRCLKPEDFIDPP